MGLVAPPSGCNNQGGGGGGGGSGSNVTSFTLVNTDLTITTDQPGSFTVNLALALPSLTYLGAGQFLFDNTNGNPDVFYQIPPAQFQNLGNVGRLDYPSFSTQIDANTSTWFNANVTVTEFPAGTFTFSNGLAAPVVWTSGAAVPGGLDTEIQYNNAGVFGGITGFIYNGSEVEISDTIFRISDEIDPTKKLAFRTDGIATGNTRTITALDFSGTDVLSSAPLTATRIPFWTAAGLLDSANLVWDNTNSKLNLLSAGTAALPTLGIGVTTTGLRLNGTALSFSISGIEKFTMTAAGALTISNPANTFQYQLTPAAIVANRILNLPLTTATDTLAVLGLAQTFTANQTFSADLIRTSTFTAGGNGSAVNRLTAGVITTNAPVYKLTNAGGTVNPFILSVNSASATAGILSLLYDSTNQLMLAHGNGTNHIVGAAIQLANLTNTAGSEAADMIFLTHNAGAAISQKMRISKVGNIVAGAEAALATNATDGFLYIPTCAGTPTGVPTTYTGKVAMVYDTTNNKFYIYNGAWRGGTTPGAFV